MAVELSKGRVMPGEEASEYVENIISPKKQVKGNWIELTLKDVYIVESRGAIDFSGKEAKSGRLKKHPKLKKEGDDYGWWTLGSGQYVIEFNEKISLPENSYAALHPKPDLVINESSHPTMIFHPKENLCHITLSVGAPGIDLKENSRISRISIFET